MSECDCEHPKHHPHFGCCMTEVRPGVWERSPATHIYRGQKMCYNCFVWNRAGEHYKGGVCYTKRF